jgi:hypothetical protein
MLNPDYYAFPETAIMGNSLYLEDTTAPTTTLTTELYYLRFDGCVGVGGGGGIVARPALISPNFSNQFTPPFTVR